MKPEWLKIKWYPHIDLPIEYKGVNALVKYVTNAKTITSHSFLPLIRRKQISHRFKKDKNGKIIRNNKIRKITYASHLDSAIYAYYAYLLQNHYEAFLKDNSLQEEVCAYRKIVRNDGKGNKCNIHIAKDVFDVILQKTQNGENVSVITFDIKGFFDNLDHKIIKDTWKQITNSVSLSDDSYAVYKSITHYAYVMEDDIFRHFKDNIICKTSTKKVERKVKRKSYLRDKNAIAFCDRNMISEIRKSGLIKRREKSETKGIPQGLPISAVIANIYMCNFDKDVSTKIKQLGGLYKRYSDDIIIVCPIELGHILKKWIYEKIKSVNLEIEESKTNFFTFCKQGNGEIMCKHEMKGTNKVLEYLGFAFDGKRILLKNASVGKFYTKMGKNVRRSIALATHINNKTFGKIFENQLIYKFSYAGAKIHLIRKRSATNPSKFYVIKGRHTYGNYLTYVRKSATTMMNPAIAKQLRRTSYILKKKITYAKNQTNMMSEWKIKNEILKYGRIYH